MYLISQIEMKHIKLLNLEELKRNSISIKLPSGEITLEVFEDTAKENDQGVGTLRLTLIRKLQFKEQLAELMRLYCEGYKPKTDTKSRIQSMSDLSIHAGPDLPLSMYPKKLESFLSVEIDSATEIINSVISTLRWRFRLESSVYPSSQINTYCSRDKSSGWRLIFQPEKEPYFNKKQPLKVDNTLLVETLELSVVDGGGLTGHELLREAKLICNASSRASLIMGVAAIEVRLKDLVSFLSPSSEWLIKELPSPPVVSIIKHYLAELLEIEGQGSKNDIEAFRQTEHFKRIDTAITHRNKASHKGHNGLNGDEIYDTLNSFEQFLWFCDYLSGFEWASHYFDNELLSHLPNLK